MIYLRSLFTIAVSLIWCGCLLGDQPPGELLDLSRWRLTLPVDTDRPAEPDEISQPELKSFIDDRHFFVDKEAGGVVFRAHCGGDTTKGSNYPRCELREMTNNGKRAEWSTVGRAVHTMTMRAAITKTPEVKQHVVCAQIHDAKDDLLMIRLEREKLFIESSEGGDLMLERRYQLGTPFDLKIQAGKGQVSVWFNGKRSMNWQVSRDGCYFKAGCYTQSNPSKGDQPESFGEVILYELTVQ